MGLVRRLGRLSKPTLLFATVVPTALLGWLDLAAGPYITFAVFYIIPVAILTWFVGRAAGLAMATACGGLWFYDAIGAIPNSLPAAVVAWSAVNRVTLFILVMWLLAALKSSLEHHKRLAATDEMTGLSNRREYLAAASREISRARRNGTPLTVVYADCDNLKQVNDRLGHSVGDRVILEVARTLQRHLRESDTIARLGGDEFAILLPETDERSAQTVIRKLRERVQEAMDKQGWPVTLSMGVATFVEPPEAADVLVGKADQLQYEVKHAGKNSVRFQTIGRKAA